MNPRNPSAEPVTWRVLLNRAFGPERWSVIGRYIFDDPAGRARMPTLHVISVMRVSTLLVVQEWPDDHGFVYYFESPSFQIEKCLAELEAWQAAKGVLP